MLKQTPPGGRKLVADSGLRTFMLCAQGAWGCSLLCSWALEASFGIPDAETAIAPLCLQCPRLAPVPGLRHPRTTGSRLQLAVSVSSELKSWPRRVLAEVLLAGHFSIRPAPGASGVRAGPASPPLGEAPTAGFLGAWASASRDTTQEHLATRLYPVTTAESREVPCLSCTPDGSLESPCQTSDCCSTGRHVECQCPRLAPVPGLCHPRTTGSWLQLAVSVSSELKSWPRRVLAEVLLAGHFSIRPGSYHIPKK
nr:uncharacterized protein LOC127488873 isoform X2 [Oryctolagus cuniculus]